MLGIYTRLSKEDDASNSIKNQKREALLFAKKMNFQNNYKIYDEGEGYSGGLTIEERPALKELIDDVKDGLVKVIWMRNQQRLERNSFTFHLFVKIAKEHNLDVYFGDGEKQDYNNPKSVLYGSIFSDFSTYTRTNQGYMTKISLKLNMKEGFVHGVIPFGYAKDENRKMVIHGGEADTVKLIFRLSLKGMGYRSIAVELNKKNIQTRYNKIGKGEKKNTKWSAGSVRGIIKNEVYKGIRKTKDGSIYEVEPIFEAYYFDKVNKNLKNNMNSGMKQTKHPYLLNGINTCGVCGKGFNGRAFDPKKNILYRCVTKRFGVNSCGNEGVRLNILDNLIWDIYFKNNEIIKLMNNEYDKIMLQQELLHLYAEVGGIEKELAEKITEKKNVVKLRASGELSASEVRETLDDIELEITRIHNLQFDKGKIFDEITTNLDNMADVDDDFKNAHKVETFEDKQAIIQKYISEITVTKNPKQHIHIHVDFIAPNIDSDDVIVDKYYKWYYEPKRKNIESLNGFKIDSKAILKEIKSAFKM